MIIKQEFGVNGFISLFIQLTPRVRRRALTLKAGRAIHARLDPFVRQSCSFSLTTQSGGRFANILHIPIRASVAAMALQQMVLIPEEQSKLT